MSEPSLELPAFFLSLLGLMGAAASTGMPMWRVTAFVGENIIVFETRYEGLWMNCFKQAEIRMQCKVYDSLLALPPDLQAARGLTCASLALAGLGLLASLAGLRCTSCVGGGGGGGGGGDEARFKRLTLVGSGVAILLACLCLLVPVSWTAHVIISDFYNPLLIDAQRRELGEALYIGWVSSALLFVGGCLFTCCNLARDEDKAGRGGGNDGYVYSRNSEYLTYPPSAVLPPQAFQPQRLVTLPQMAPEPLLSRQPSASYSYHSGYPSGHASGHASGHPSEYPSRYPSRYPSVRSGVAYL
ncbi:claudin-4-like [Stigmatopora nigra]